MFVSPLAHLFFLHRYQKYKALYDASILPIGWSLPLRVTLSIFLNHGLTRSLSIMNIVPLIRMAVPYYLVAVSNRAAIFTLGLKYEASILYIDPIAPYICM